MRGLLLGMMLLSGSAFAGSTYDWRTGNTYNTQRQPDGGANGQGYNYNTGSQWNTQVRPNGNMNGTDAKGNQWNYNAQSKTYMNYGTGTICTGTGYARVCN